jgi:hypothetical protein
MYRECTPSAIASQDLDAALAYTENRVAVIQVFGFPRGNTDFSPVTRRPQFFVYYEKADIRRRIMNPVAGSTPRDKRRVHQPL